MRKPYWRESADGLTLVQESTPEESRQWSIGQAIVVWCTVGLVLWGFIIYSVAWVLQ